MIIKNPFTLSISEYRRKNIKEIYIYTKVCTEIYIRERLTHNIKTGSISYSSDFYVPHFYRDRWKSYCIIYKKRKESFLKQEKRKKKIKYEHNMERINFGTSIGLGTSLREAIVFNKKTGYVSYTSYFEQRLIS